MQSMQMPEMTLVRKKGSQQMMNTPITVPRVLAAFFSFANLVTWQRGRYSKYLTRCYGTVGMTDHLWTNNTWCSFS